MVIYILPLNDIRILPFRLTGNFLLVSPFTSYTPPNPLQRGSFTELSILDFLLIIKWFTVYYPSHKYFTPCGLRQ